MTLPNPGDTSQPKPLRYVAAFVAAVQVIVGVLPLFGVPLTAEQIGGIAAVLAALGAIAFVGFSEPKVTPVSSPRDDLGRPLVPATPGHGTPESYSGGTVHP